MFRIATPYRVAVITTLVLLAACGDGSGGGSDKKAVGPAEYEIAGAACDPLRGTGTIINRAGEPAAFRVKVHYEYSSGERRPTQSTTTPVLADGESFDFAAGPDSSGSAPSSCRIIGADRIEASDGEIAEAEERRAAEPDAEPMSGTIDAVWVMEGINGAVRTVAMRDGVGFLASSLARGTGIAAFDAASGSIIWEAESDHRFERLEAAADGALLAASGDLLVAFDTDGQQLWEVQPLSRPGGSHHSTISQIVATDDVVVVGGSAPGSIAGIDPSSGKQLWYVHQDESLDDAPIGFGGGDAHLSVSDHGVLVSGGAPALRHLTLFEVEGNEPEVVWAIEGAGSNVASNGQIAVDAVEENVTAFDLATGEQLWQASDEAWTQSPAAQPAIVGDTVIVQRANSTIAFALDSGDRLWEETDLSVVLTTLGGELRAGDRVFGLKSTVEYVLIGLEGTVVDLDFARQDFGSVGAAAAEDDKILLSAHGSTDRQPSAVWLLDLSGVD